MVRYELKIYDVSSLSGLWSEESSGQDSERELRESGVSCGQAANGGERDVTRVS